MKRQKINCIYILLILIINTTVVAQKSNSKAEVFHKTINIDNVELFYREAGTPNNPTLLLLHGFPSSSFMFRNLINKLKEEYYILAPDFPGFGYSSMPSPSEFEYTFENYSIILEKFLIRKNIAKCHIYIFDYGAPIGMRLIQRKPDILLKLIVQNGNIYQEGISEVLKQTKKNIDSNTDSAKLEVAKLFELDYTKFEYLTGVSNTKKISRDGYSLDQFLMDRPGNKKIQYLLKYDYRFNLDEYPKWQLTLRKLQPKTIIVWGENDPIFLKEGALAFKKDLTNVEFNFYPTGHFALEEFGEEIGSKILLFLNKN